MAMESINCCWRSRCWCLLCCLLALSSMHPPVASAAARSNRDRTKLLSYNYSITEAHHHGSWSDRLYALRNRVHSCILPSTATALGSTRGITFCAGDSMVPDVYRTVFQLRHIWNTTLPLMIAHCAEISPENQEKIKSIDPCIVVTDICAESSDGRIFGMEKQAGLKRLRSFYCKVAALYHSPFPETVVVDVDVAWFKSPEVLFNYDGYKSTGALFFRDHTNVQDPTHPPGLDRPLPDILRLFLKSRNVAVDNVSARKRIANATTTHSLYWRSIAGTGPYLNDYQDSSVVVLDKRTHPKTISLLKEFIELSYLGYGDKELFWLSATIAKEPFVFEPFLAAHYGDCTGLILHYDPNDALHPLSAQPLYINGENIIEIQHLEAVGSWWRKDITRPVLIGPETILTQVGCAANKSTAWKDASGCTCRLYGCVRTPDAITHRFAQLQWLTLSLHRQQVQHLSLKSVSDQPDKLRPNDSPGTSHPSTHTERTGICIPVAYYVAPVVLRAVDELLAHSHYCSFAGCPLFAPLNFSLPWRTGDIYCDPVSFSHKNAPALHKLATLARHPNTPENTVHITNGELIRCGREVNIYLVMNGTLCDVPDPENAHRFIVPPRPLQHVQQYQYQTTSMHTKPYYPAYPPIRIISSRLCDTLSLGPPVPRDSRLWTKLTTFFRQSRANFLFYVKNKLPLDLPQA